MSIPAAVPPTPAIPLARIPDPHTLDDVVQGIDGVLQWSIAAGSNLGYFAVLYKRVTIGIRDAVNADLFDDGARMERLGIAFGRRYFNALNGFFHPSGDDGLTLPWEVAFLGDRSNQSTMLQHMMTGLNAHITFDLGLALIAAAPTTLGAVEKDFDRVNALLCSQIPGMLDAVEKLSPTVRHIRWIVPSEVWLLRRMLTKLRKSAWYYAIFMAMNPDRAREKRVNQASWSSAVGAWYLHPPARLTAVPILVRAIARRESRDVAENVRTLEALTAEPAQMSKAFL